MLEKQPELVNTDPYGNGWMIKMTVTDTAAWLH
jgi:glycine cleavage system H protein